MKIREMLELLDDDGWSLVRTSGSHRQYRHPTKAGLVTVAGKPSSTRKPGTEGSILQLLRDAGEPVPEPAEAADVTLLDPAAA